MDPRTFREACGGGRKITRPKHTHDFNKNKIWDGEVMENYSAQEFVQLFSSTH